MNVSASRRVGPIPFRPVRKASLLVVGGDKVAFQYYRAALAEYDVQHAGTAEALAAVIHEIFSAALVMIDIPAPAESGEVPFATLKTLLNEQPLLKCIVVMSTDDRQQAIGAIDAGAHDVCARSIDLGVLKGIIGRAVTVHDLEQESNAAKARRAAGRVKGVLSGSAEMLKICSSVERLAKTDVTVLLSGESGTGKEALARALHDLGPRKDGPFVAINCGAVPDFLLEGELFGSGDIVAGPNGVVSGRIGHAAGGTLFLDEIGDLPLAIQGKLLRYLKEQTIERAGAPHWIRVDVRIVSATNILLEDRVAAGTFRQDLYYRLNPVTLHIPPLRERSSDIPLLARHFLEAANKQFARSIRGFSEPTIRALLDHAWPGNVRELENRIKRGVVMADGKLLTEADLDLSTPGVRNAERLDLRSARAKAELDVLQKALARSKGKVSGAAKLLGISRPTLYSLLAAHGLSQYAVRSASFVRGNAQASSSAKLGEANLSADLS